jgi:hypothetical protein
MLIVPMVENVVVLSNKGKSKCGVLHNVDLFSCGKVLKYPKLKLLSILGIPVALVHVSSKEKIANTQVIKQVKR